MLTRFRAALVVAVGLSVGGGVAVADPGPDVTVNSCEQRILVLSAFPAEADAVLSHTTLDSNPVVVADRKHFYLGTISGKKVIVAMTGIGLVNATNTTETAFARFTCASSIAIGAVVFSGVAGGGSRPKIGDVAVPAQWTLDNGATFHPVDPGMLATAQTLSVALENTNTLGNDNCLCKNAPIVRLNNLGRQPQLVVGGDGLQQRQQQRHGIPLRPEQRRRFWLPTLHRTRSLTVLHRQLRSGGGALAAQGSDRQPELRIPEPGLRCAGQETAAAQAVADAHGVPFLGIRGISDGQGDPLHLPGFPVSFFYYKQTRGGQRRPGDGGLPAELARHLTAIRAPRPTGRFGSEHHSDHDPGNSAASRPSAASAATVTVAVTPEPQ